MRFRPSHRACALVALSLLVGSPADARERRDRLTPGLVLDTGARHASCDALLFSPDGGELLAAGDDKVVRIWQADEKSLRPGSRVLRWPIYREQRGGIYAMALSPNDGGARVAVAGFGVLPGLVAVLNRRDGTIVDLLGPPVPSQEVNWSIAWSPDGKYVVYGNEKGEVYRWRPGAKVREVEPFAGSGGVTRNRVRLVVFVDAKRFLSVAQDGKLWVRDVTAPKQKPAAPFDAFPGRKEGQEIAVAAYSPAGKLLAGCAEDDLDKVHLVDLTDRLAARPTRKLDPIRLPPDCETERFGWSLAFNARGDRLAVGTRETNKGAKKPLQFARVTGGRVFVYAVAGGKHDLLTSPKGLDCGYAVDAVAFRPKSDDQLASAGGPHHEVRLWRVVGEARPLSTIRGPGSSIYAVRFDTKGNYFAWQEGLNPRPTHPNDRGAGAWRYFKLDRNARRILASKPDDFRPHDPLATCDGWKVETTANSYVWTVVDTRRGESFALTEESNRYIRAEAQVPRCYTFLPATKTKPVRLAIGHMWGVSLYELRRSGRGVVLSRFMVGHEGEVMALAPSADGRLLLTASRDQTIACWSLEDWPSQAELGGRFKLDHGKLVVDQVDPGSPIWDVGLTDGDEVLAVASKDRLGTSAVVYNPGKLDLQKYRLKLPGKPREASDKAILARLNQAEPIREYFFVWRDQHEKEHDGGTTVRQRPLWRFFPTRQDAGSQWVLWRWRDFYYDTMSPQADRLLGWHVNREPLTRKPGFHRLSHFSGGGLRDAKGARVGFYDPDKVWDFVKDVRLKPEKVIFPDIEPPLVSVRVPPERTKADDAVLRIRVTPRDESAKQQIARVVLWLDDVRHEHAFVPDKKTGAIDDTVTIPGSRLRNGDNLVKVVAFNARGGRAEASVKVAYRDPNRPEPTLRALCVGLNYEAGQAGQLGKLTFARRDARDMADVFQRQRGTKRFAFSKVDPVEEKDATRAGILSRLKALAQGVGPDDLLVLFLAGHGMGGRNNEADIFRFLCVDRTELTGDDLREALGNIPCRKLVFLNACFSGNVTQSSPTRALNDKDGAEFRIFSACKPGQTALDLTEKHVKDHAPDVRRNTLFTQCVLYALDRPVKRDKGAARPTITDAQLAVAIERRMKVLLEKMGRTTDTQEPEFFPDLKSMRESPLELLTGP